MTRRRRQRRSRLLGVMLLVLVLEGAWQVTALVHSSLASTALPRTDSQAGLVVLCVGDSNTFGLHVPSQSYPEQLRARLAPRYSDGVQIVNRGVPGMNSSQAIDGLLKDLEPLNPDLVLILAGINDAWNSATSAEQPAAPWWTHLKLVEFAANLVAGDTRAAEQRIEADDKGELIVHHGAASFEVNPGTGNLVRQGAALKATVSHQLRRAVLACRAAGARPVLMTYAENRGNFATVNQATRNVATAQAVLLVDHALVFEPAFAEGRYDQLMFTNDQHPNVAGYALMTDTLIATLDEAKWLPDPKAPAHNQPLRPAPAQPQLVALSESELKLRGEPGWSWQLLVADTAPRGAAGLPLGALTLPLLPGPCLSLSRAQPAFSGRFDDNGHTSLHLPAALFSAARGPLSAVLLLLHDPGDPRATANPIASHSEPLQLRQP